MIVDLAREVNPSSYSYIRHAPFASLQEHGGCHGGASFGQSDNEKVSLFCFPNRTRVIRRMVGSETCCPNCCCTAVSIAGNFVPSSQASGSLAASTCQLSHPKFCHALLDKSNTFRFPTFFILVDKQKAVINEIFGVALRGL